MPTPSPLRAKALEAVERYQMIQPGDTVAAGVSGGADSVALLDFLRHLRRSVPFTLLVCHLDHQLRGEESRRDAAFVRELAERWGLPYRCRQADAAAWARLHRLTVEEAGRQLRYAFFRECAGETGKIATAHTLSDSMETVLLNLCRGTGPRGLRGIPPVRGNIIRPLFACTRREVEDYCQERGLAFVTDSTNLLPDYSRNRIRLEVLPRLELLNPAAVMRKGWSVATLEGKVLTTVAEVTEGQRLTTILADGEVISVVQSYHRKGEAYAEETGY